MMTNIQIGGALITEDVPMKRCYSCKKIKPVSDFGGKKGCSTCREESRSYMARRNAGLLPKQLAQKKRITTMEKCFEFYDEDGYSPFEDWVAWYNDTITKDGKLMPLLTMDFCEDHDVDLWYEGLLLWDSLGRPKMPEGWKPNEERDFPIDASERAGTE